MDRRRAARGRRCGVHRVQAQAGGAPQARDRRAGLLSRRCDRARPRAPVNRIVDGTGRRRHDVVSGVVLWTFNVFGWWTDRRKELPYVVACVVLVGLLPIASFRNALVTEVLPRDRVHRVLGDRAPSTATINPDGSCGLAADGFTQERHGPVHGQFAILALASFDRPMVTLRLHDRPGRRRLPRAGASPFDHRARCRPRSRCSSCGRCASWPAATARLAAAIVVTSIVTVVAVWLAYLDDRPGAARRVWQGFDPHRTHRR